MTHFVLIFLALAAEVGYAQSTRLRVVIPAAPEQSMFVLYSTCTSSRPLTQVPSWSNDKSHTSLIPFSACFKQKVKSPMLNGAPGYRICSYSVYGRLLTLLRWTDLLFPLPASRPLKGSWRTTRSMKTGLLQFPFRIDSPSTQEGESPRLGERSV